MELLENVKRDKLDIYMFHWEVSSETAVQKFLHVLTIDQVWSFCHICGKTDDL